MMELLFGPDGWAIPMLNGFAITMQVAILAYFFSFVFGIFWSAIASSKRGVIRSIWSIYSSIIMGVPPLLVIFFVFYNLPVLLRTATGTYIDVSPFVASVVALAIVFSAYLGETFRGAFLDVPKGQFEACNSLGLSQFTTLSKVILPQIFRLALPGMSNIWIIVLKDTAYVSLVGLTDIVRVAYVASGTTNEPFLFFIASGTVFVVLAVVSAFGMRKLEQTIDKPYNMRPARNG